MTIGVQGSAQPPAKKTAGQIEKETPQVSYKVLGFLSDLNGERRTYFCVNEYQ